MLRPQSLPVMATRFIRLASGTVASMRGGSRRRALFHRWAVPYTDEQLALRNVGERKQAGADRRERT